MVAMGGVTVVVVNEVVMIAVGNPLVPTFGTVDMRVVLMDDMCFARTFVPMAVMLTVTMPVVQVVGMVAVGDGGVPASCTVNVLMLVVCLVGSGHDGWCSSSVAVVWLLSG